MKHLENLFISMVVEVIEAWDRIANIFRKKPKPSLIASNIYWCTHSEWMDRLVAYKHLELWTDR